MDTFSKEACKTAEYEIWKLIDDKKRRFFEKEPAILYYQNRSFSAQACY